MRVESLVHGGEGLARHEGQVVFLRGGAPGDLVEAELSPAPRKESFLRGRVLRVLEAGRARVEAPCPIVAHCGGCPLQQVSYAEQLHQKELLVRDALARLGGLDLGAVQLDAIAPSPLQLRYRRRARLHRGPGGSWGFASGAGATDGIVPVAECLLFAPPLQELADAARAQIAALGGLPDVTDLGLDTSETGKGALDLRTRAAPTKALRRKAQQLLETVPRLRGLTLGPLGAPELLGDPVLADAEAGPLRLRLRSRPDLFAQANRSAVPLLQAAVLEALGPAAQGRLLELFCGSGTLTLPLLATARSLIGVEFAAASLLLLRRSADEAGLAHPPSGAEAEPLLRLVTGDAARVAQSLAATERGRLDAVLLDPPRTGAPEAVRAAAQLEAPRLVYVSCDAPTLGRDAKELARLGYRLVRASPLDLFPQTAHLEIVATFDQRA